MEEKNCQNHIAISMLIDEVKEIKKDVKELIGFQHKILGIVVAISTFFTFIGFIVSNFIK